MKKIVILAAQNFQDEEFVYPYYRFQEENYHVDVATPGGIDMPGKYGVPARATVSLENIMESDYDCVLIPGGFESPDRLRMREDVKLFVRQMYETGKLVAAICHGPWVCISAGIMNGKKAAAYISIKDDIINSGAEYIDEEVVVDRNLITAPHYRNNGIFMKTVINYLNKEK